METTSWKKQAHYIKLLNQEKTIKLIQRLYIGDNLNDKQVRQIMDFVNENGFRVEKRYDYPPTDICPARIVKYQGMEYAGLFVYQDNWCTNIDFYDHRENRMKNLKIYDDGKILC